MVYWHLLQYHGDSSHGWINNLLVQKEKTHKRWSSYPDERIITWDMPGHNFTKIEITKGDPIFKRDIRGENNE